MAREPTGYELRDHTADIGLHVWGDTLESLFRSAAEGYYAVVGDLRPCRATESESFEIDAIDVEALLHDFLSELLFRLETAGLMFRDFVFERLDDTGLRAAATCAKVDTAASVFDREVKAVTFHDLSIVERHGRYEVTVVLDI